MTTKERWESMTEEERHQHWWRMTDRGVQPTEWGRPWEELSLLTRVCLKSVIHHQPESSP